MTQINKIKLIGSDNCEDCLLLLTILEDYIKEEDLNIEIEKIQSISDEAIDIAIEQDINKIPFAIYNKKKLIFDKQTNRSKIKEFLTQ